MIRLGKQCEMVILNQHEWPVCAFNLFEDCRCKFLIHALVMLPIRGAKNGTRMGNMAERPNSFVREAEIVALLLFLRQPETTQGVVRMVGRNAQAVLRIDGLPVGIRGTVGDPGAVACVQNRFESRHQSTCGHAGFDSLAAVNMLVRLAVGNHKQRPAVQAFLNIRAQPVRGPE